ncbi:MAG: DUF4199 domain-containing protein [Tannerellaceae bacterium]
MEDNQNLLLRSAMTYGFSLGIYWVIKYLFFIFSVSVPALSFVYWLLTLAVPFIAYYLTRRYKQDIGSSISFFHAWRFGMMIYFFAALIVSLEHFIFYQYIAAPDFMANSVGQVVDLLKSSNVETDVIESISKIAMPSPIHMAIQGIFNNVFYGIVLSIPVAALLCRNNETGATIQKEKQDEI